ncbi:MAG: hypothetical protein H6Q93_1580 [Nitrospirae bacterium]|nr:hypothetical protein [Nitrospirota bacterium]
MNSEKHLRIHVKRGGGIVTMRWKKIILIAMIILLLLYGMLSIPVKDTPQMSGAGKQSFAWNQNEMWQALEAKFRDARSAGCPAAEPGIRKHLQEGYGQLAIMAGRPSEPSAFLFDAVESNLFNLGPLMAACPEHIDEYEKLVSSMREAVKLQSRTWDVHDRTVRDRLYRLLYGGRTALEEVMLQAPRDSRPAMMPGTNEPSQSPSFQYGGVELHSGDILLSRGGAPTSALIARGNDYPGNFSHIGLLYVDEVTHTPSVIEAHIERGVVISSLKEYLKDVKLRVMVMRVRADHPLLVKDPMLPHRAVTTMSSPGVVNWLGDFGVRYFETQAPADLEYDPQLVVVAEWRDMGALWDDHVDNAVTEAMLEKADRGLRLSYDWYLLAPARLVKGYSVILNKFGKVGPIPEGMSTPVALKSMRLDKLHKQIKKQVLAEADAFEQKNRYRPPYWELVKMAGDAFKTQSSL